MEKGVGVAPQPHENLVNILDLLILYFQIHDLMLV